jgi:hypothetical protein
MRNSGSVWCTEAGIEGLRYEKLLPIEFQWAFYNNSSSSSSSSSTNSNNSPLNVILTVLIALRNGFFRGMVMGLR